MVNQSVALTEDPTRTGEMSSLEKPFQCEHCDKCFSDYHNFSNHVEHYHGFNRKCNFPNCDVGSKSIQEFVQHHVRHTGKSFSEALILASTNAQYDKRLFIDLQVQYVHENYKLRTCCVHKLF